MDFAEGARAALTLAEQTTYDVIVSDMKMPGMSGVEFLRIIKERYPSTVRLILSGYSDRDLILQTVCVAHGFLSKPCNVNELVEAIRHSLQVREIYLDENIKQLLNSIERIPSIPHSYIEIVTQLESETSSIDEICAIIERDPLVCAKILHLSNSSYFCQQQEVSSLEVAVSTIGVEILKSLFLVSSIFSSLDMGPEESEYVDRLIDYCVQVSRISERITESSPANSEEMVQKSLAAGLLHKVGEVFLLSQGPAIYKRFHEANSAKVSAYLLGIWGLPTAIVEAVAFYAQPSESVSSTFCAATALHIARALLPEPVFQAPDRAPVLDAAYLARLGESSSLDDWRKYTVP